MNKSGKSAILISGVAALSLGGCATAVRGTSVDFMVATDPSGARVTTDLETRESRSARKANPDLAPVYYGCDVTPCAFEVSRRSNFIVTIEKDGFHTGLMDVESNVDLLGTAATQGGNYVTTTAGTAYALSTVGTSGGLFAGLASFTQIIVTGGAVLVGTVAVDVSSGALLGLDPNPLNVQLIPEDEPVPERYKGFDMLPGWFDPELHADLLAEETPPSS